MIKTLLINSTKNKKMKTLHCSDAGFDCKAVVKANTTEEVLQQAAKHALDVHGVAVTPEMAAQISTLIKEEE
jgi:predicted small metal-binding protein